MRRRSRWLAGLLTLLALVGVAVLGIQLGREHASRFPLDPTKPIEISYDRIGFPQFVGMNFTISTDGRVRMERTTTQRLLQPPWEETTFTLPPEVMATLPELIESSGIMGLRAEYENPAVHDGAWVIVSITQGGRTKSVQCKNHFPPEFTTFTHGLTESVLKHSENAKWVPKPD